MLKVSTFVAAAALTLTACASESGGASQTSDSPSITIYSGRSEEIIAPLLEKFTAETGIATVVRYGDSAELAAQILEEGDNAKADVFFSQDAGALGALSQAGVLTQLPSNISSLVAAKYRASDDTWVGVSGRGRVFSYNPVKVKVLPTSVLELAQPEWKGRIGMKSLVEEASSISKAIEKAWARAGKPHSFSVKIYEEPQSGFLGFNSKPAKIGIFFEEEVSRQERDHSKKPFVSTGSRDRAPQRDGERYFVYCI